MTYICTKEKCIWRTPEGFCPKQTCSYQRKVVKKKKTGIRPLQLVRRIMKVRKINIDEFSKQVGYSKNYVQAMFYGQQKVTEKFIESVQKNMELSKREAYQLNKSFLEYQERQK